MRQCKCDDHSQRGHLALVESSNHECCCNEIGASMVHRALAQDANLARPHLQVCVSERTPSASSERKCVPSTASSSCLTVESSSSAKACADIAIALVGLQCCCCLFQSGVKLQSGGSNFLKLASVQPTSLANAMVCAAPRPRGSSNDSLMFQNRTDQ